MAMAACPASISKNESLRSKVDRIPLVDFHHPFDPALGQERNADVGLKTLLGLGNGFLLVVRLRRDLGDLDNSAFLNGAPRQAVPRPQSDVRRGLGEESPPAREPEGLQDRVEHQNIRRIHAELVGQLFEQDAQHQLEVEAAADGHIHRAHGGEPLHPFFGQGVEAAQVQVALAQFFHPGGQFRLRQFLVGNILHVRDDVQRLVL